MEKNDVAFYMLIPFLDEQALLESEIKEIKASYQFESRRLVRRAEIKRRGLTWMHVANISFA
jgi:hypothetical protein